MTTEGTMREMKQLVITIREGSVSGALQAALKLAEVLEREHLIETDTKEFKVTSEGHQLRFNWQRE